MVVALMLMDLGIGFALFCFHDAGAISDETFLAALAFVIALCAGVLIAMDMERAANPRARKRHRQVPPPVDFYTVWPPDQTGRRGKSCRRQSAAPKSGSTKGEP